MDLGFMDAGRPTNITEYLNTNAGYGINRIRKHAV
jgi:hypothetical protein